MNYKIHDEKNYSYNTSLSDVNDDETGMLTSGNRKIEYAIQSTQNHLVFSLAIMIKVNFLMLRCLGEGDISLYLKLIMRAILLPLKFTAQCIVFKLSYYRFKFTN